MMSNEWSQKNHMPAGKLQVDETYCELTQSVKEEKAVENHYATVGKAVNASGNPKRQQEVEKGKI